MAPKKTQSLSSLMVEQNTIDSIFLERAVQVDVYLPTNVKHPELMEVLLINDGQDLPNMPFDEMLRGLLTQNKIEPLLCIGIYCGPDRKNEYGTANQPDYLNRGAKAGLYSRFIFEELLPFIRTNYGLPSFKEKSFAGFSMGGLSAMDIVWNNPEEFTKAGIFSGSLWWRSRSYKDNYDDEKHRIMHQQVKNGEYYNWLKFFFECGRMDETADRNNNGVIDSIDDTLDIIKDLKKIGFPDKSIKYLELPDGSHDVATWGRAFPYFLQWGWGK